MAIAAVAYNELTARERARLVAILRQHPDLTPIVDGFGGQAVDDRALVMAMASWPDMIRDRHEYRDNNVGPGPITNIQFEFLKNRGWHFRNVPVWVDAPPQAANMPRPKAVNAVTTMNVLIRQLRSNEDDAAKAYDLGWLFHLVGDMHQPLHAVSGISRWLPKGDGGGNEVLVAGEGKLHSFWDSVLGSAPAHDLARCVTAADAILGSLGSVALPTQQRNSINPEQWSKESVSMASEDVYGRLRLQPGTVTEDGEPKKAMKTKFDAQGKYRERAAKVARERIKLAGHRLALLLKTFLH